MRPPEMQVQAEAGTAPPPPTQILPGAAAQPKAEWDSRWKPRRKRHHLRVAMRRRTTASEEPAPAGPGKRPAARGRGTPDEPRRRRSKQADASHPRADQPQGAGSASS